MLQFLLRFASSVVNSQILLTEGFQERAKALQFFRCVEGSNM
jgi:hypothetical protein